MIDNQDIFEFLSSTHKNGRSGFTDEGWNHYISILKIIAHKMFNPEYPESKFVELCVSEKWDYVKAIADTRNREAIEYCDLFRIFIQYIKSRSDYKQLNREKKINKLI